MVTAVTSKKVKLDKIDRKILSDLQSDGRMTNVELADRAGISAPPCLRRVRALEEDGLIMGYFGRLNAKKLGFGVTCFATVRLTDQNDDHMTKFEDTVNSWPEVREAYVISGDYDYLLRVVAHDWEEYQTFLTERLTKLPNVASVRSAIEVRSVKYQPGVPVEVD